MPEAASVQQFRVEHQEGRDLRIYDPAYRHIFGIEANQNRDRIDALFYDIMTSPAGERMLAINQLSKSEAEETYEGSHRLKRWQHIAGVYHLVRELGSQTSYNEEEIAQFAVIACLPDFAHGVKSHVTDMLKEGMGGKERFHDLRAGQLLDLGGINDIFAKHEFRSPFNSRGEPKIDVPPWVERKPPGLNVDRFHYINAEGSGMFPRNEAFAEAIKVENLFITEDGELAFKDAEHALAWAKVANLCSSEHWNDPINRLVELLILEGMKRTIDRRYIKDVAYLDNGFVGNPEDYTYLVDQDFDEALEREALNPTPDIFMNAIYSLIQSISQRERQRFAKHKRLAYEQFISDHDAREFPNALVNPHRAAFGVPPASVQILQSEKGEKTDQEIDTPLVLGEDGAVLGTLKQLKFRQFDPLVRVGDKVKPLSKANKKFNSLLVQHSHALRHVGKVALYINVESSVALTQGAEENRQFMSYSESRSHLSDDQIRNILRGSGQKAIDLSREQGIWIDL